MPAGFVVSNKFIGKEEFIEEVNISLQIAFGEHGLGELLSEERPFLLVVVADNQEQLQLAQKELEEVTKRTKEGNPQYIGKIKIDGFVKPEIKETDKEVEESLAA